MRRVQALVMLLCSVVCSVAAVGCVRQGPLFHCPCMPCCCSLVS